MQNESSNQIYPSSSIFPSSWNSNDHERWNKQNVKIHGNSLCKRLAAERMSRLFLASSPVWHPVIASTMCCHFISQLAKTRSFWVSMDHVLACFVWDWRPNSSLLSSYVFRVTYFVCGQSFHGPGAKKRLSVQKTAHQALELRQLSQPGHKKGNGIPCSMCLVCSKLE